MAKKEERFEVTFRDGSQLKDEGVRQILIVSGFSRPVLLKLDLCPLPERRHIDRL